MDYLREFVANALADPPEMPPTPDEPDGFWQNLRSLKRVDEPPPRYTRRWQDLKTFRQTVARRMREYMAEPDPQRMLLIPAPPGSGKTYAGVEFAHWVYAQTHHRVLYAGPYKAFYGDVLTQVVKLEQDLNLWYDWKPRQASDDIELHTCNHAEKIVEWMNMGYEGLDFCKKVCNFDYMKICPYHKQKKRKEPLTYGHHMHVTLGHPWAKEFAVIVGDELPLDAFVREWVIPAARLKIPDNIPYESPLAPILNELHKLADLGSQKSIAGPDLLEYLGGAEAIRDAIDDNTLAFLNSAAVVAPSIGQNADISRVPANYLPEFLRMLKREALAALTGNDYPERLFVDKKGLTILTRRVVNEQYRKHIIWFDATGTQELYKAMFQRDVEVLDAQPEPLGRIFQLTDRGNGKSSLVRREKDKETGELGELTETGRAGQLRAQIDQICKKYKNPGIVTHKAIEESVRQQIGEQWGKRIRHFGQARGTNELEDSDVLIVAGTPMPPIPAIVKMAKCLWPRRMRPFNDAFVTVDRLYQYAGEEGEGYSYPVSQFIDPELNTILWQKREGEIIQMAHRSRMLSNKTDVYLLTNIPVDELPPYKLLTIRELFKAPLGVDVFKWGEVIEFADSLGAVGTKDLMEKFGFHRDTARKYVEFLAALPGWEIMAVKSSGAGRPQNGARRMDNNA